MLDQKQVNDLLSKCMECFTTQSLQMFFPESENLVTITASGHATINRNHAFWKHYPSARWCMNVLLNAFCQGYNDRSEEFFKAYAYSYMSWALRESLYNRIQGFPPEFLIALGGEHYESSAVDGLLMVLCPKGVDLNALGKKGATLFSPDARQRITQKNVHAIRKQLNMAHYGEALLIAYLDSESEEREGDFYTVGIGGKAFSDLFPCVRFMNHASWRLIIPDAGTLSENSEVRYDSGLFLLPTLDLSQGEMKQIEKWLKDADSTEKDVAKKVLEIVQKQKKGAVVILGEDDIISEETKRLCLNKMNRGIALLKPTELLASDNCLLQMTAIDGALLIDLHGYCHACGVILDGEATVSGDMARGARYNSTNNYIQGLRAKYRSRKKSLLAIVVSEDGMVNIL